MLLNWLNKYPWPIGLDLGTRCVKMVQLQPGSDGRLSVAAAIECLPPGSGGDASAGNEALEKTIHRLLRRARFIGRQVVCSLPAQRYEYRTMRIAPMAEADMDSAVHWEAANHLGLQADSFMTQFFDAGEVWEEDQRRREIVAMIAPMTGLQEQLALLTRCGLRPLAVEVAPAALLRCLAPLADASADAPPRFLLDIGQRTSSLLIVQDLAVRFIRRIDKGLAHLDQHIAQSLKIASDQAEKLRDHLREHAPRAVAASTADDRGARNRRGAPKDGGKDWPVENVSREDAQRALVTAAQHIAGEIVAELSRCLRYYGVTFRDRQPAQGIVVGGGALETALTDELAAQSGVEFDGADGLSGVPWDQVAGQLPGHASPALWAVATGLSLHGRAPGAVRGAA